MSYRQYPLLSLSICLAFTGCDEPKTAKDPIVVTFPDMDGQDMTTDMGDMKKAEDPTWASADDLPDKCIQQTKPWDGVQQAFSNKTSKTGLDTMKVNAVRLSTVDFDNDGYPDLIARRGGTYEDEWKQDGVRGLWLLRNNKDGSFTDITQASGITARRDNKPNLGRPAEVMAWGDVDNDGDLDVLTAFTQKALDYPAIGEVMLNNGDGTFALGPLAENAFRMQNGIATIGGLALIDADRDGKLDVWVGHGNSEQDHFYLGNGVGAFLRKTEEAGLLTKPWNNIEDLNKALAHSNSWSVAACDFNQDGTSDLLSASYGRAPNHLWLGALDASGKISFTNNSIASNYAFDHRQDWSDNESARCLCQIQPDAPDCEGVPKPEIIPCQKVEDAFRWTHANDRSPFRLGGNSGTSVCADINNDGLLDILTTEIVHFDVGSSSDPSEILYNKGGGIFERPGNEETGLVRKRPNPRIWDSGDITAAVFDFDNDGRQDIYIGSTSYPNTRGHLFHQQPDGTFKEVLELLGISHKSSHGIAIADYDRDGDLDVIAGHARDRCSSGSHCYETANARYYENVYGATKNNWLQIKLVGQDGTNRSAIGAQVTIETPLGKQVQEVGGGHGHYGIQHDLALHFGLGQACDVKVSIRWPDKSLTTQTINLKAGYRYRVVQGNAPQVRRTDLER